MSQSDTSSAFARRGCDGLAQIGPTRFDIAHVRFIEGEQSEPGGPAEPAADTEHGSEPDAEEQGSDGDQEDEDDDGFDGEFDAKRARRTITRLRRERNTAREAAKTAKSDPETARLQSENLRLRVAMRVGLDDDLADRLKGTTEDELLEDAQKLLDRFYPADKKPQTRQPKPNLKGGSEPDAEPELSADDIVKQALGR